MASPRGFPWESRACFEELVGAGRFELPTPGPPEMTAASNFFFGFSSYRALIIQFRDLFPSRRLQDRGGP